MEKAPNWCLFYLHYRADDSYTAAKEHSDKLFLMFMRF
ncbi:hypothetical protein J2X05_000554 [Cellvibrio fibrivorans]|uniref:Uncharacterized protein n=1 Tax=Cellvibrio fibrivorans TaxID=126350 RepID=A0ABU1UTP7_9GAMM|nr:hypothetical protein [Cellvibrio fibrivorans]